MRIVEQHKMIQEVKDYLSTMSKADRYDLEMFQKRDKDDEELDTISIAKLEAMHKRYVVKKTKQDIDALFRKFTSGGGENKE